MTSPVSSFNDILFARARREPEAPAYRFLSPGKPADVLTMGGIDLAIRQIGAALQARGLRGERVVLALPHGPDFILAFFACLAAGAVAVPVPQQRTGKVDARFDSVLRSARPALVVVDAGSRDWVAGRVESQAAGPGRIEVLTPAGLAGDADAFRPVPADAGTLAVIQYTSGSTGDPKGVMITHANMLANCDLICRTLELRRDSAGVMWLPFYHDMGLVGAVLVPMYREGCVDLMSPQDFLRAPMSWLKALSDISATTTAAPNFALEMCCDFATPEILSGLDLSALGCLLTGSEPVNPNTLERFAATFAPCGFRYDAFLPAYGLAEATLLATGTLRHGTGPSIISLDARALAERTIRAPVEGSPSARFVGNGAPNGFVRIADPETGRSVPDGAIGEIWLCGPSIARGYWGLPELSSQAFGARLADDPAAGPFYRTGDLGFVRNDDLFIAGRLKDLIIVRGRNIYPQDIEEVVTRDQPLLWTGAAAAFAVNRGHGEEVVVVAEAALASVNALRDPAIAQELVATLLQRIADSHDIAPAELVIIRPGRLPRTSSGKIRRSAAQAEWQDSGFAGVEVHRWTRPEPRPVLAIALPDHAGPLGRKELETWLLDQLAHHSGQARHLIDLDEPFASYGLDSVTAIEMIEAINRLDIGGRKVDPVDLYDHPTIAKLLDHMFGTSKPDETANRGAAVPDGDGLSDLEREAASLRALLGD